MSKRKICVVTGTREEYGQLDFNVDKPDGTMKKLTDVSKLHGLDWKHKIKLRDGVRRCMRGIRKIFEIFKIKYIHLIILIVIAYFYNNYIPLNCKNLEDTV